jgi:hypothetical protein
MVYMQHNFVQNLKNALQYNDIQAAQQILSAETGKLVDSDRDAVIQALKDASITVPEDIKDDNLMQVLAYNITVAKPKVIENLVNLAVSSKEKEYSNIAAGVGQAIGGVANFGASIAGLFGGIGETKRAKEATKQSKEATRQAQLMALASMQQAKAQQAMARMQQPKKDNTLPIILGVIGVLAIGVVTIVIIKKKKQ